MALVPELSVFLADTSLSRDEKEKKGDVVDPQPVTRSDQKSGRTGLGVPEHRG